MSDRTDWQRDRQTRRRPDDPPTRLGEGMAVVPNRTRPLTGSQCDEWQWGMAVGLYVDGVGPVFRPRLSCWHCGGEHLSHECEEER